MSNNGGMTFFNGHSAVFFVTTIIPSKNSSPYFWNVLTSTRKKISLMKVLMVCLGNICRSPLAEGILAAKVANNPDWVVESAGTSNYHIGDRPDVRAVKTGKKYGIDISNQTARQFHPSDFDVYDMIYVADRSVRDKLLSIASNEAHRNKIQLLLNELMPGSDAEIPDPYFGGDEGFENVFKLIDEAADAIVKKYNK